MKKNSWIFLFALLFFSCKNPMLEENNQKGYGVINFSSAVRTVKEDFDINSLSSIKLYQNNSEEADDILIKEWNSYQEFVSDSLSVKVGTYKFYITAKIENVEFKSDIKTVVIEEFSTNTINFKIHVTNRGEGTGIVSIEFTFGYEPVSESSFELNKISYQDGKRVLDRVELDSSVLKVKMIDESKQYYATFESNLTPGVYELETRFENTSNVAIYPVTIHVSEGCKSADKIEVLNFNPFYDITYYDGETPIADLDNTYYPTKYSIYDEVEFPPYEKSYYEFEGWYTDSSFTNKIETIDKYEFAEDLSLHAKWSLEDSQYLLFDYESVQDPDSPEWKDYYKFSMFEENLVSSAVISEENPQIPENYEFPVIGGPDFFYYLIDDPDGGVYVLKKSNDESFNIEAVVESAEEFVFIDDIFYDNESDTLYGLGTKYSIEEVPQDLVLCSYNKNENCFTLTSTFDADYHFDTDITEHNTFVVRNNKTYILYKEMDEINTVYLDIFDPNGGAPTKINISNSFGDNLLPVNLSINDMTVIDEKIYILWSYSNSEYSADYNSDEPLKIESFGGVLCVNEDATVENLFTTPSVAKEIIIPSSSYSDNALVNYYGPSSESDKNCLFGPTKFIAIKPKKLVFADEGISVNNDAEDFNNPKYKNINRVVEIDLENNRVVKDVSVSFTKDMENAIEVYCGYSSIVNDATVSAQ